MKVPPVTHSPLAADQAIERDEEGGHQLVVGFRFRVFEQAFDERMMAGAVERHLQILEDLLAGPGSRILLPAIGQSGEILGIAHCPHTIDEPIVLAGETFIDEQCRRLAFVRIRAHHPLGTESSRSMAAPRSRRAGEPIRYSGRISVVNQLTPYLSIARSCREAGHTDYL